MSSPRTRWLAVVVIALVCVAVCYYQLSRPGMLLGLTEYDDATYFGTAVRLVHGVIPYRDFVYVQPPGLPLLLTPFAALSYAIGTRDGLALARIAMPLLAGAQVLLVGRLIRHRGLAATIVACGVMAFYTDSIVAQHTVLLEPVSCLFCLIGFALAFEGDRLSSDRRLVWAGIALGFAGSVKVWAVVPALVLAIACVPAWRRALRVAAGAAAGFFVPVLPFLATAPGTFIHEVIVIQLERALPERVSLHYRLSEMLGLSGFTSDLAGNTASNHLVDEMAVVLLVFVVVAYALPWRGWPRLDLVALATAGLMAGALLVPAEFYYHYPAFLTPWAALALGVATSRYSDAVHRRLAEGNVRRVLQALALAGLAAAVVAVATTDFVLLGHVNEYDPGPSVDAVVPAGGCAITDDPGYLVSANRLVSSVPGCPPFVDDSGIALADDNGRAASVPGSLSQQLVATWLNAINHADYLVFSSGASYRLPLTPPVVADIQKNFYTVDSQGLEVEVRNGFPVANPAQVQRINPTIP